MERGIIAISENGMVTMPTAPVWMTMEEIADMFMVFCYDIRTAVHAIYKNHELLEEETKRYIRQVDGTRYEVYSLEMVIALAFRLRGRECLIFRKFVIDRLNTSHSRKSHSPFLFVSPHHNGRRADS